MRPEFACGISRQSICPAQRPEANVRKCRTCLLPAAVPGAELDASGQCTPCRLHKRSGNSADPELTRRTFETDLEATLASTRGAGQYDVLVPFSGGKDSALLLYKLVVERGLRVLAFTVDVNIPPIAWQNIRRTVDKLGCDLVTFTPPAAFYRKLFRFLLSHQEARGAVYTVSYVYAPLFEGDAIRLAMEKNIPLVLAGYSPGQPEPERMHYEFSRPLIESTDWTPPALRDSGEFSAEELQRFFNPATFPTGTRFPRYLAPFHAWEYDQDEAMRLVVQKGLIENSRKASPIFSNYPINWLMMYSDLRNFGYNPYAPEFAALIRAGKANLRQWKILGPLVDLMIRRQWFMGRHITSHLRWLDLTPEQLRITLPRGAYDPPQP